MISLTTDSQMSDIYKGRSEGKKYEMLIRGQWEETGDEYSFSVSCKYREKKELKIIYVPVHADGGYEVHYYQITKEDVVDLVKRQKQFIGYVKFVEAKDND